MEALTKGGHFGTGRERASNVGVPSRWQYCRLILHAYGLVPTRNCFVLAFRDAMPGSFFRKTLCDGVNDTQTRKSSTKKLSRFRLHPLRFLYHVGGKLFCSSIT